MNVVSMRCLTVSMRDLRTDKFKLRGVILLVRSILWFRVLRQVMTSNPNKAKHNRCGTMTMQRRFPGVKGLVETRRWLEEKVGRIGNVLVHACTKTPRKHTICVSPSKERKVLWKRKKCSLKICDCYFWEPFTGGIES
jgi:hypothetical protein